MPPEAAARRRAKGRPGSRRRRDQFVRRNALVYERRVVGSTRIARRAAPRMQEREKSSDRGLSVDADRYADARWPSFSTARQAHRPPVDVAHGTLHRGEAAGIAPAISASSSFAACAMARPSAGSNESMPLTFLQPQDLRVIPATVSISRRRAMSVCSGRMRRALPGPDQITSPSPVFSMRDTAYAVAVLENACG